MEKRCTKCKQVKPLTEFDRHGRQSWCKACRRAMRRAKYVPHPMPLIQVEQGQRFGRLTVLGEVGGTPRRVFCTCDCGNDVTVVLKYLTRGDTSSCGCLARDLTVQRNRSAKWRASNTIHGQVGHPLYKTWQGMMARCYNPKHSGFRNYGERGITVCESWHDAAAFTAWIDANLGPRPADRSLDRVDNERGYEPGNVRWATRSEQRRNRRSKEQCDASPTATAGA